MSLNLSTANAALKDDYQALIRRQLNDTNVLLAQIERTSDDVEGRNAVFSLHVGRNHGVGARAELGTLPAAQSQQYVEQRTPLRYNYGSIRISGPVIRAMKSNRGSFTRAVESESKGIVADLKRDVNRQAHGTSDGVIVATAATTASTTVNLGGNYVQRRQLEVGMVIDIGTVASPTSVAAARTITAVGATTVTISGAAVTTDTTHRIFRTGSGGAGASQRELTGLQTIVADTGALFGVDPATTPVWSSARFHNNGTLRSPSDTLFGQALDEINIRSGQDASLLLTSHGVVRSYAATLTAQKRFTNTLNLRGGFKALAVASGREEVPLAADRDHPPNQVTAIKTDQIRQHESSDWEFMDEDGAVLSRVPDVDAYEAVLFKYHELVTDQRNVHARVEDLTEA